MKHTFAMDRVYLRLQINFQITKHSSCGSNSSQVWSKKLCQIRIFLICYIDVKLWNSPISNIKVNVYSDICIRKAGAGDRKCLSLNFTYCNCSNTLPNKSGREDRKTWGFCRYWADSWSFVRYFALHVRRFLNCFLCVSRDVICLYACDA
jgi:hypothetical protein